MAKTTIRIKLNSQNVVIIDDMSILPKGLGEDPGGLPTYLLTKTGAIFTLVYK